MSKHERNIDDYVDSPPGFKEVFRFQILNDNQYKYPVRFINNLQYKQKHEPSRELFCELIKNNWLPLKYTPSAEYGAIGDLVINIDDITFPIDNKKLLVITDNKNNQIITNNGKINYKEYYIFKGSL